MVEFFMITSGIIERGLIFSLVTTAMYLTSRIIHFDDLTIEGSFGIGGAVMATGLLLGVPWYITIIGACISGALAGMLTGLLYTQFKMNNLISGIVVTTGLFSLILKIATSNSVIAHTTTIFNMAPHTFYFMRYLFILIPFITSIITLIYWFLRTEIGYLLYALGDNPRIIINLGKSPHTYTIATLTIANAITALAGALFVQYVGYFSIWSSVGVLIIALAGLMLSEILGTSFGIGTVFGAIVYQAVITATFELHIDPDWNKLITAVLIVLLMLLKQWRSHTHA